MSEPHIAVVGAPSQSGLTNEEQRDLITQLVQDLDLRVGRFPTAPNDNIARVKGLLSSVFLPQFGQLNISQPQGPCEVIPRGKARDTVLRELFHNSFRSD